MNSAASSSVCTDVVISNRVLLLHNVIQCEGLHLALQRAKVFPDDMIEDIKSSETMLKRNEKMLELLKLRGINYNNAFIDALQLSGHNMIADTLRDEIMIGSQSKVTWTDISQKLSSLDKTITKPHKEKIVDIINTKISENVAREIWRRQDVDKEKIVETKQLQLEANWTFSDKLKEKDSEIYNLKSGLQRATEVVTINSDNVSDLNEVMDQLKKTHKEDMTSQMKYNTANEKSLQRLTERYNETHSTLTMLTDTLRERVQHHRRLAEGQGQARRPDAAVEEDERGKEHEDGEDDDDVKDGVQGRGRRTLTDTLALIDRLHAEGRERESLIEERRAIAELLITETDSNLAENLDIYMANMASKVETMQKSLKTLTSDLANVKHDTSMTSNPDHVIKELNRTISVQSAKAEELKCVIAALEARIASMTALLATATSGSTSARTTIAPVKHHKRHVTESPTHRAAIDVHPFNAGRALPNRGSPHNGVSTNGARVNSDPPKKAMSVASSYADRNRGPVGRVGVSTNGGSAVGNLTLFPVIGITTRGGRSGGSRPSRVLHDQKNGGIGVNGGGGGSVVNMAQVTRKGIASQPRWKSQLPR